jgi:uncharacterized protein
MKRLLLACVIAAFSAPVFAQDGPPRVSEIATSGRAEIRVPAGRATVLFSVENFAKSAATAASDNARISMAVLSSLRYHGVGDDQMTNGGYSVYQDFEKGDRTKPRGFNARNTIRVEVPRIETVGSVIDAGLGAGAANVAPIQYGTGDLSIVRRVALKNAAAEARRDAEVLADAAGGSLGRLLSMSSGNLNPGTSLRSIESVMVTGAGSSSYTPTELRPGDLMVSAIASGRWEFLPRR